MNISRRSTLIALAAMPLAGALPALAQDDKSTAVAVSFWDNPDMAMETGLGYGMDGDMAKASMGFKLDVSTAPAGEITFTGVNDSKDIEHEMILAPLPADGSPLPYDESSGRVDEDAAGALGEISELQPGEKGTLTLHLKAGDYILFCNIPAHYMAGMWTLFTVT